MNMYNLKRINLSKNYLEYEGTLLGVYNSKEEAVEVLDNIRKREESFGNNYKIVNPFTLIVYDKSESVGENRYIYVISEYEN